MYDFLKTEIVEYVKIKEASYEKRIISVLCAAMLMSLIAVPGLGAETTEAEEGTSEIPGLFELSDTDGRQVIGYEVSNASQDSIYAGIFVEFFDESGAEIGVASAYTPCVDLGEVAFIYVTNYFGEDYAEYTIQTTEGISDYVSAADDLADLDVIENDGYLTCTTENSSSETIQLPQVTVVYMQDSEPTAVSTGMLKAEDSTELCLSSGQTGTADIACPEEYDDYVYYLTAIVGETEESGTETESAGEESEETDEALTEEQYKEQCVEYTYDEIARNPDDYLFTYAKYTGEVIQVMEDGDTVQLRMDITPTSYGGYTDTIFVEYTREAGESRILENDIVTVYGMNFGTVSYESVMGQTITIPAVLASYVELN